MKNFEAGQAVIVKNSERNEINILHRWLWLKS